MRWRRVSGPARAAGDALNNEEFVPPEQMIQQLLIDNRHLVEMQYAAIEVCDKNRDSATSNLLQEILDQTEKRVLVPVRGQPGQPASA
jgi:DNA-binding ferritin-like protein